MSERISKRDGQRGAALVVCLLIMAVLSLLAAAMITSSIIEVKVSGSQRASKVDFYTADGAARLLVNRLSAPGDPVGNVADTSQIDFPLAPNATEPADASVPGNWALAVPASGLPSYHYRIWYLRKGNPTKGYSANTFAGYYYQVDCLVNSTCVSTVNMKIGPK